MIKIELKRYLQDIGLMKKPLRWYQADTVLRFSRNRGMKTGQMTVWLNKNKVGKTKWQQQTK